MNSLPTAVFLDRDGTIIEDAHYISRADQVKLIAGAAAAIARINGALVPVILVTNQSGIGRGFFMTEDYRRVQERLEILLAAHGAHVDATYYCPHAQDFDCDCRKPRPLLFRRAAEENRGIDLARSLYVGDRWRDIEFGVSQGAPAALIPSPETSPEDVVKASDRARVAPSLGVALDWFLCAN